MELMKINYCSASSLSKIEFSSATEKHVEEKYTSLIVNSWVGLKKWDYRIMKMTYYASHIHDPLENEKSEAALCQKLEKSLNNVEIDKNLILKFENIAN